MSFNKSAASLTATAVFVTAWLTGALKAKAEWVEQIDDPRICKIALFTPDLTRLNCETVFAILANMRRAGIPIQHMPTRDENDGRTFDEMKHANGTTLVTIEGKPARNIWDRPTR
jgi:hypothetical protein